MNALKGALLAAALAAAAATSVAQAPEAGAEAEPTPAPPAAEQPDPEGFDRAEADDDIFRPSDEIQADEEVTFPVDI